MNVLVDGRPIEATGTVLDACRAAGAWVPTLCAREELSIGGHCRACLVEVDGRFVASCATPLRDGMRVTTKGEKLAAYRRELAELLLATCRPQGEALEALRRMGGTGERYPRRVHAPAPDATHPYLRIDLDRCVMCRLCIRACEEVQGAFVWAAVNRGWEARVSWGGGPFVRTACVSCGACVAACPSEAITDRDRERAATSATAATAVPERVVRTTCAYCGVGCQLEVHARGDDVLRIDGVATSPVNRGHLCVKGRYAHAWRTSEDRLTRPLVRRGADLVATSWPDALKTMAEGLARNRGKIAGLSSSRCTNEENYLFQKWMRAALGTNDVDCCARVCHGPSAAGLRRAFGTGAATNSLADLERADLLLVVGSNTTESHPITGARIRQAALSGARLVVVDPRRTEIADGADVHLQLRPGTNVPLLNALAHVLVTENLIDRTFVDARTEGYVELERFLQAFSPEATEPVTGVPAELVRRAARLYGTAKRPMQVHGLGVSEHFQGTESVMLLCNLAMLVGAVGREGVGVNPLRGQNNVQGAADMGCQPDLLTGYLDPSAPDVKQRFEREWVAQLPATPGRTLPRIYDAIRRGDVRALVVFGEDVVQTDPDATRIVETLRMLDLLVVIEIFPSETAKLAHVVLPGAGFLEKDGTFTNGERRVQRVRKVFDPPGEARADWQVLLACMKATGLEQRYESPAAIMEEVGRVAPATFGGVRYERLEGDGLQWPVPGPAHPGTPILYDDTFARGRGKLSCIEFLPSPSLRHADDELLLVTGRVLEHYNTGSMTRRTPNAELAPNDELVMHPDDAHLRDVADGDPVEVTSKFGRARAVARLGDSVTRGTAFLSFHWPGTGTNRITTDVLDRLADCPEYKLTPVRVARARTD